MDEKEELLIKIREITGYAPEGVSRLLTLLAHPEVIEYTKRYIGTMDVASCCLNYEHPWSCIREAEASYQNIKYGWVGGASGIGLDESWCENCIKKVMEQ